MAQANVKLTVDATNATRALQGVQNQTNKLKDSFAGIKNAIVGIGFTVLAKNTIQQSVNFQTLQIRMKALTSEFGEFEQVQELVTKAQDKFNLSIIEATKSVTDMFARLRPLGISLKEIEIAFDGFNTLAIAAGLNANELNSAFTQLSQGLGSGQLQGDEFRSIAEQIPQLLSAISKETGIAEGKLKSFASKGLLKTDIIIRALANSTEEYSDTVNEIIKNSPEATFKSLNNALLGLQITLANNFLPSILAVTKGLTSLVKALTRFLDSELGQVTLLFSSIAIGLKAVSVASAFLIPKLIALKTSFIAAAVSSALAQKGLVGVASTAYATATGISAVTLAAHGLKVALAQTGIGLAIVGLGLLIAEIMKTVNAQKTLNDLIKEGSFAQLEAEIKDLEKEQEILNKQLDETTRILDVISALGLELFIRDTGDIKRDLKQVNKDLKKLKEGLEPARLRDVQKSFERQKESLEKSNEALERSNKLEEELTERDKIRRDFAEEKIAIQEKYNDVQAEELIALLKINRDRKLAAVDIRENTQRLKDMLKVYEQIGKSVEDGIVSNLADAVEGTKTLAEAAMSVLNDLKRKLIEVAIQRTILSFNIGGRIGDFLKDVFKADGGPVNRGAGYIVGERGPEMFVPNTSGTIVPNSGLSMGGGGVTNVITVNVDANSSDVTGNNSEANQLGNQLAIAIQSELIKQKRAGGLLA